MVFSKAEIEKLRKWRKLAVEASTNPGSSAALELDEVRVLKILDEMHRMCLRVNPRGANYFVYLKRLYVAFAREKISFNYFRYQLNLLNAFYGVR